MQTIRLSSRAKVITVWILLILTVLFLYRVRSIALPFFWAMVTAYIFTPLIRILSKRTRVPRIWWIVLLYISLGGLIYWAIAVLVPIMIRQYEDLLNIAPEIVDNIQAFIIENSRLELFGYSINLESLSDELVTMLGDLARSLPEQALYGVTLVFETAVNGLIFLIATFYFLLHGEKWAQEVVGLLPPHVQADLTPLFQRIHITLTAYIRGQLFLIAIMSTLTYIALVILRVRFALVLALMTGILEIIPWLGPVTAGGITSLVVLFQPDTPFGWSNFTLFVVIVVIYTVLRQLEDQIIIPNLVGYMVDLPPLLVIFVILAGGSVGGAMGLLVAIPLAATIKIILRYLYAKLMDKPVVFEELPQRKSRKKRRGRRRQEEKEVSS
jgi:predicted PurR-regulated permease PerM